MRTFSSVYAFNAARFGLRAATCITNDAQGGGSGAISPKEEYTVTQDKIKTNEFLEFKDEYIVHPPYQRKTVWSARKKQALLDSLLRGYYIPRLVLRKVQLDENKVIMEVVDGQQRITTMQEFYNGDIKLPDTLADLHNGLAGKHYTKLPVELRRFISRKTMDADIITGIDDPRNRRHHEIAAEIFWRLQQGEPLNRMEVAHARLSSTLRNFIVARTDDYDFDYKKYAPIDPNPRKHNFFKRVVARKNDRMQHLSMFGRMLLIERAGGATEIKDDHIDSWVDETKRDNGVGDADSFASDPVASRAISTLDCLVKIFGEDLMIDDHSGVKELSTEYFIISVYMLVRHLDKHYDIRGDVRHLVREFVIEFHNRWKTKADDDRDMVSFSDRRQQNKEDLEIRDRVMRHSFFDFLCEKGKEIKARDSKRSFNEAQRISVYRRDKGFCQECLSERKPDSEARVSWSEYQIDHIIPWIEGGETIEENARVLCRHHNLSRGGRMSR